MCEPAEHLGAALRLRPLRMDDEAVIRCAQVTMAREDFEFALRLGADQPWASYLEQLERGRFGVALPGLVPATFVVAEVAGVLVGRASIRHQLNDWLTAHGGHIGYGVLPEFRRRGYATEILRQALVIARAAGVDRVLVTCNDDNVASIRTIEICGGRLDEEWPTATEDGVVGRRYWID